jgi:hypothetical protein
MTVRLPRYPKEEFARRGDEIYNRDIRPLVETDQNKGKLVLIDIETGAWEMDADEMTASRRMDARLPDAQVWMVRVGYPYVRRFGAGRLRREV